MSRDSNVFLMSPQREGCTLTLSLKKSCQSIDSSGSPKGTPIGPSPASHLVIAAVRILVGSTATDCIPRTVRIQGRLVSLQKGLKKWYSLSLTDQEIALSARTGIVTVGISQAHEASSNALVDAVEVYAMEKKEIASWLPTTLSNRFCGVSNQIETCTDTSLVVTANALASLSSLLGSKKKLSDDENNLLKDMIQEIAFNRDKTLSACIENLLAKVYPDSQARTSFHDEGVLFAVSKIIGHCQKVLAEAKCDDESTFESAWFTVRTLLGKCLRSAATISKCRPINYLRAAQKINNVTDGNFPGSIAVKSSKLICETIRMAQQCEDDVIYSLVELSLSESAIDANTDTETGLLASFKVVRNLLELTDIGVVECACHAISSFCRTYAARTQRNSNETGLFAALQAARLVCYQCDGCQCFPIQRIRYTLLEESQLDIDLCENCWKVAEEYARSKNFDSSRVIINEREMPFTCALLNAMQPVPIVKSDVKEMNEIEPATEQEELQRALLLSLGNAADEVASPSSSSPVTVDQAFEDFSDGLFTCIVELLAKDLSGVGLISQVRLERIVELLVDLVQCSSEKNENKKKRAKKVSSEIAAGVSRLLNAAEKGDKEGRLTLIICLRALGQLISPDEICLGEGDSGSSKTVRESGKSKQVVCELHGVPAVRRRCARGEHKDRRFYVCGMERKSRCGFFRWADEIGKSKDSPKPNAEKRTVDTEIAKQMWDIFSTPTDICSDPLQIQLCTFLEQILLSWKSGTSSPLPLIDTKSPGTNGMALFSIYSQEDATIEHADGVFCSRDKLHDVNILDRLSQKGKRNLFGISSVTGNGETKLVEVSLELLALIANHEAEEIDKWFCLLCEIIGSPNKSSSTRTLAKRTLKQLTGGDRDLYHKIRGKSGTVQIVPQ